MPCAEVLRICELQLPAYTQKASQSVWFCIRSVARRLQTHSPSVAFRVPSVDHRPRTRQYPYMKFATHTLADAEFQMTSEERLKYSLENPGSSRAMTPAKVGNVSMARIRLAMSELAHGEIDSVRAWLHEVAKTNPARAVELFIQLAEFSLPKLKAVALAIDDPGGSRRPLSIDELQRIVSDQ